MKHTDIGVKWFETDYYPKHHHARAVHMYGKQGSIDRLYGEKITFFTPWGPRYDWKIRGVKILPEHKEVKLLQYLKKEVFQKLEVILSRREFIWIFVAADLYGTRINNLPPEMVSEYFRELEQWVRKIFNGTADFQIWSAYDTKAKTFRKIAKENMSELLPSHIHTRAKLTAEKMGGGESQSYLIERMAEAMLIDELYKPIKISCAPRHKDDHVDLKLPRLYLVPDELRVPWLGK